jgi:hypothetical protein
VFHLRLHDRERGQKRGLGAVGNARLVHKRLGELDETLERHREDVLTIQPKTFVEVENRIAAVDVFQIEKLADLGDIESLTVLAGRPTEETEIVDHRLGRVAEIHEVGDARTAVALTQFLPLVI